MQALLKGCHSVVVTKMDGTLGTCQKGEVEFLERHGFIYYNMNIKEFVILRHPDAPQEETWNLRMWALGTRSRNCEAATAHSKNPSMRSGSMVRIMNIHLAAMSLRRIY